MTGPLSVSTAAITHTVFGEERLGEERLGEEGGECGVRILVVDDDQNVAETVRRMMVAEGWVVEGWVVEVGVVEVGGAVMVNVSWSLIEWPSSAVIR